MKLVVLVLGVSLLTIAAIVTVFVEREGEYRQEVIGAAGRARALVLFRPSRDTHFSDDLSSQAETGVKIADRSSDI